MDNSYFFTGGIGELVANVVFWLVVFACLFFMLARSSWGEDTAEDRDHR